MCVVLLILQNISYHDYSYVYIKMVSSLKGQCVGIEAMQSHVISQPVKSLLDLLSLEFAELIISMEEHGLSSKACCERLPKETRMMLYICSCSVHKNTHCNNETRRSAIVIE